MMITSIRRIAALLVTLVALTAASAASAQTYTLYRTVTGPGGVTGTMQIELANSTLANNVSLFGPPTADLVNFTLTLNGLGGSPTTTTITRSDLVAFYFTTDSIGAISDINFQSSTNADGYDATPIVVYETDITKGGYTVRITNVASTAPAAVPTLTEWAMILLGLALAGGAALVIQRRRTLA